MCTNKCGHSFRFSSLEGLVKQTPTFGPFATSKHYEVHSNINHLMGFHNCDSNYRVFVTIIVLTSINQLISLHLDEVHWRNWCNFFSFFLLHQMEFFVVIKRTYTSKRQISDPKPSWIELREDLRQLVQLLILQRKLVIGMNW